MLGKLLVSGLVAAMSVLGSVGSVNAEGRDAYYMMADWIIVNPNRPFWLQEYEGRDRIACQPTPNTFDGSYLLSGQRVVMMSRYAHPTHSLVSYRGNRCWVNDNNLIQEDRE